MIRTTLKDKLIALLFPSTCFCCGELVELGGWVCEDCLQQLNKCKANRIKYVRRNNREFAIRSVYYYKDAAEASVRRLKYNNSTRPSKFMGRLIADKALRMKNFKADAVAYVPMMYLPKVKRGYNQSELIANYTAKALKLPLEHVLKKVCDTEAQHTLSGNERIKNVEGAFAVKSNYDVRGHNVLLIDDVVTTGSTACECASVLLDAGAESVTIFTFCAATYDK